MSWLLDKVPDDDFDSRPPDAEAEAPPAPAPTASRRTQADEILDAVAGRPPSPNGSDLRKCPRCGSATKQRCGTVMQTTITRRCVNPRCRNEYPVASVPARSYMPPVPADPLLNGGPYVNGPSRGAGGAGAPMERDVPMHRRLAEFIRRLTHDGE